jgi:hypothetical protein
MNLKFTVLVGSDRGGFVWVAAGRNQILFEGRIVGRGLDVADITAVVTHSTHPLFPPGTTALFSFWDRATGDLFGAGAFQVPLFQPITSGRITFRP